MRDWEEPPHGGGMPRLALPRPGRATKALLIANGGIFVATFVLYLTPTDLHRWLVTTLGLVAGDWREGFPLVPLWQLATYGFLHSATDVWHIFGNLLMLYFFGTMLEEILGSRRFLVAYASAQLVGALFFLVPGLFTGSSVPVVGASGAVYGVMIALATLRPGQTVFLLFIPVTLRILALLVLALTLFQLALNWKSGTTDGVAHLVHLGGIVYGFLAVRTGLLFHDPVAALERRRGERDAASRARNEARMDQLLAKIQREGIGSLSRTERAFLERMSSRR